MHMCMCVCNCTLQTEASNRGKCSCLTSNSIIFFILSLLALLVHHTRLHLAPLIFFSPNYSFIFTPVFMHQCVYLSVTVSNKLVCFLERLSPHSVLITVSVSVIFSACHSDRWSVCLSVCDISGATLLIFGFWIEEGQVNLAPINYYRA